jgi:flavorubredoxin
MTTTILFESGSHKNVMLEGFEEGSSIPTNQHVVIHEGRAAVLDPGGHKIYSRVLSETTSQLRGGKLESILLSHQDPDIVAAVNGWLMTTDAVAYAPRLWVRFIPHFGLDRLVQDRLKPVPDEGMRLPLGTSELWLLPAHFLHSPGNFQVYDPVSKILYTGDLGASVGVDGEVTDFAAHIPQMEGFHRRYMAGNAAMRAWAKMVRKLDIEVIAPQHGGFWRGKSKVSQFIDWCEGLNCGIDLIGDAYQVPPPRS